MTALPLSEPDFNQKRIEAFGAEMLAHFTGASVSLMTSVGYRTGLFDAIAGLPASTSAEIAAAARLQERYVREWLAVMVTARIVDYDPSTAKYELPFEHAALLTRAAGADNVAPIAQMLTGLSSIEDQLVECFHYGGGISYEAFPRFHELMSDVADASRDRFIRALPSLAPELVQRLEAGIEVLDLGCGRGFSTRRLAELYPRSRFVGYDFSAEPVDFANEQARLERLDNVRFELRDVARIDDDRKFGLVTSFDAIHDQAQPDVVIRNVYRALQPDGVYMMMEPAGSTHLHKNLDHPLGTILYAISCAHCMTVSLAQGGMGLGTMWGEELATEMLGASGFTSIRIERVEGDIENAYFFARKSDRATAA